jgi:hypothetical protein
VHSEKPIQTKMTLPEEGQFVPQAQHDWGIMLKKINGQY